MNEDLAIYRESVARFVETEMVPHDACFHHHTAGVRSQPDRDRGARGGDHGGGARHSIRVFGQWLVRATLDQERVVLRRTHSRRCD